MEEKLIYKAINATMKEIGVISKDKKNQQQGFMFRGIDQVMNTLKPIIEKHGLFIVPEIQESHREERTTKNGGNLIYTIHKVKYHFTAIDGSEVCAVVVGEGMDSADKSSNKAMAIAFKYACFQVFCIPTEEMAEDDPDNYTPEQSTRKNAPAPQPPKTQANPRPASQVPTRRERVLKYLQGLDDVTLENFRQYFKFNDLKTITDEQINTIADYLNAQKQ